MRHGYSIRKKFSRYVFNADAGFPVQSNLHSKYVIESVLF